MSRNSNIWTNIQIDLCGIIATPSKAAFKLKFTRIISTQIAMFTTGILGRSTSQTTHWTNSIFSHGARIHMNSVRLKKFSSQLDFLVSWTTKHFYFLERTLSLNWAGWYTTSAFPKVFFALLRSFAQWTSHSQGFAGIAILLEVSRSKRLIRIKVPTLAFRKLWKKSFDE